LFRIDKTLITYDRSEAAYTSVGAALRSAHRQPAVSAAEEESVRTRVLGELDAQLQDKISETEKITRDMLADAENKARQIIRQAEAEAIGIIGEAEEKGYLSGTLKAEKEMQARFEQQAEALQNIILQAGEAREGMIDELEDEIITLVLETAKKVINIELEKNDKCLWKLCKRAQPD
jgi:flagellar biosynthesis/type III secretory pathway protein FliH